MAERAELEMFGKKFDLLHCSYTFNREVDPKGRPSAAVQGGTVQLQVESTEDTSILEAMLATNKGTKGTITFQKRDEKGAKMKALTVENAYIVQYAESLDSTGGNPMTISFVLSARKLSIGNAVHENDWPDTASN